MACLCGTARIRDPSTELRKWYQHTPGKWDEFQKRYFKELDANPNAVANLESELASEINTIVFSSTERIQNNATALIKYLEARLASPDSSPSTAE